MLVQVAMEMTLDEWKAMQEMSRPKAEFNIRKAEGKIPCKAKVIHESKHVEVSVEDELWRLYGFFFFPFCFYESFLQFLRVTENRVRVLCNITAT